MMLKAVVLERLSRDRSMTRTVARLDGKRSAFASEDHFQRCATY